MIKSLYKTRTITIALAIVLVTVLFAISTAALNVREGSTPSDANNPSDSAVDSAADTGNASDDTAMTDSAAGTGEFADDTSDTAVTSGMNGTNDMNDSSGPVESALDNVVTDAEGVVSDVVDGAEDAVSGSNMSIWGIVIAIVIIAAIGFLIFAFFSKKK